MTSFHLCHVLPPAGPDPDAAAVPSALWRDLVALHNADSEALLGTDDFASEPASALAAFADQRTRRAIDVVALDGPAPAVDGSVGLAGGPDGSAGDTPVDAFAGLPTVAAAAAAPGDGAVGNSTAGADATAAVVGSLSLRMPLRDNTHLALVEILVAPDRRGEGIGTALAELAETIAAAHGRRTLHTWISHPTDPTAQGEAEPDVLIPATGVGRIPRDTAARFAQGRGYDLLQCERHSILEVADAAAHVEAWVAEAGAAAGPDYRAHLWDGAMPEHRREGMAELLRRMSVDIPNGDLELEEEVWDAERVAQGEEFTMASGSRLLTVAIEHVPSGTLVAYSRLELPTHLPTVAYQEDTFVHGEHRGRRLGLLAKALNLKALAEGFPEVRRIHTWNAGENSYMLGINERIGFREKLTEGAWEKRLGG